VNYLLQGEEDDENVKSAIKGLTACTQINDLARIFVVDHKGLYLYTYIYMVQGHC